MNTTTKEQGELALWKEIAGINLSVSHDRWHIDRVLVFARGLQSIHGGDMEVLTAAVLMHDLGRADKQRAHGEDSRKASAEQAKKILAAIDFPESKRDTAITAILEHDQHDLTPSTIEGQILKDADFLAGFGAWGILRIALWSGESGRNITTLLERLTEKMPKRLENVEFPETAQFGRREMLFANLFLQELFREPTLQKQREKGYYIVLEGISGSGKGTQAELLKQRLEKLGMEVELVHEPNNNYRAYRDAWQKRYKRDLKDPMVMKYLLMADRYQLMNDKVRPALEAGKVVITDRSFVSTLVYQCDGDYDVAVTAFDHRFTLLPDLLILFDLDADIAYERVKNRKKKRGIHETPDLLPQHRKKYLDICNKLFAKQLEVIDASGPIEQISDGVWAIFSKRKSDFTIPFGL